MDLYLIKNVVNGQCYVGTTVQAARTRFRSHLHGARDAQVGPLYDALRQYGSTAFVCCVLAQFDDYDALLQAERDEIARRSTLFPSGYNRVKGGKGNLGWKMSKATRNKISQKRLGTTPWNKGLVMDGSYRDRCRQREERLRNSGFRKGGQNKGQAASEAAKAKMSAVRKGVPWTDKRRQAQSKIGPYPESGKQKVAERKRQWWAALALQERAAHVAKMHSSIPRAS